VKSQFGAHVGVGAWFNSGVEHGSVPEDGCFGRDDTGGEMRAENAPANETAKEASAKKAAATK
jgi:hypothetical protein